MDYESVKGVMTNYIKTKQLSTSLIRTGRRGHDYDDPMEVDAIKGGKKGKDYKGKGGKGGKPSYYGGQKSNSKDKGGKGGGKGKTNDGGKNNTSAKYCQNCKTKTHNTRDCWWTKPKNVRAVEQDTTQQTEQDAQQPEEEASAMSTKSNTKGVSAVRTMAIGDNLLENGSRYYVISMIAQELQRKQARQAMLQHILQGGRMPGPQVKPQPNTQWEALFAIDHLRGCDSDIIMLDSGAQVCVCPPDYAPECPINYDLEFTPNLRSVTGAPLTVYGVKYVDYELDRLERMIVKYYVTDVTSPIISVDGLTDNYYEVKFAQRPTLKLRGLEICSLLRVDGLTYLCPQSRRKLSDYYDDHRFRVVAASGSGQDYWRIEGTKAVRVHCRPRLRKYVPSTKTTYPGTMNEKDPWLHRLGDVRTTKIRFYNKAETIIQEDSWMHINSNDPLPELWTGETIFEYRPVGSGDKPTITDLPTIESGSDIIQTTNRAVDHWVREGLTWTRYHMTLRDPLFKPDLSPDGPDPRQLDDRRTTTMRYDDGTTKVFSDNWREPMPEHPFGIKPSWTGTTVFHEKAHYPQLLLDDVVDEAVMPRMSATPQEPTQEERELHNLTHMPYRSWCPLCVRTKGRGDYHKQRYDKKPVVQVDYCFLTSTLDGEDGAKEKVDVPILSAIDVSTGLVASAIVKCKGVDDYALKELQRFILESGRSGGILQSDQETSIRALCREVALKSNMTARLSPTYSSQSLGAVERWHKELWGQVRLMRESVKTNYGLTITIRQPLTQWMVKHASWTHNRYQLHTDGKTSYERRWGNNYNKPICEFAETVLFKYSAGIPNKTTVSWDYGVWLGRCTQSDEHFVGTAINIYRTRSIRRLPRPERYNAELLQSMSGTPSATRGIGKAPTIDFVLPPTTTTATADPGDATATPPTTAPAAEPTTQVEGASIDETMQVDQGASSSSTAPTVLHERPTTDPQDEQATKFRQVEVPQGIVRPRDDTTNEPNTTSASSSSPAKQLRINKISLSTIAKVEQVQTKRGGVIEVHTNENQDEMRLDDPLLTKAMESEFPAKQLSEAMNKEMSSLKHFTVYEEVLVSTIKPEELPSKLMDTRWVNRWKGNMIKSRLTARGFDEYVEDKSDIYASTPLLLTLKVLLLFALQRHWIILIGDVSTAFLHATLPQDKQMYIKPPKEYYPTNDVVWRLLRPLYGLRSAPRQWQDHFAAILQDLGGRRLKSDPSVYYFVRTTDYVFVYVDDVVLLGPNPQKLFDLIGTKVLLRLIGELKEGVTLEVLGRNLRHTGTTIQMIPSEGYIQELIDEFGLTSAKAVNTPGVSTKSTGDVSELSPDMRIHYMRGTGKLMWLVPIRSEINYATKELSRNLQTPTDEDMSKLKHVIKYLKGTIHYVYEIAPKVVTNMHAPLDIRAYVDSDWAGCRTTRKSTSGGVVQLLGCTVHHYARTQATLATSSGEAELYAIGSGVSEALGLMNFVKESNLATKIQLTIFTDSSSAKAISTRIGVSKQTKHIELRYLYMQDLVANGTLKVKYVNTLENPADVMTKHVPIAVLSHHLTTIGMCGDNYDFGNEETKLIHHIALANYMQFRSPKSFGSDRTTYPGITYQVSTITVAPTTMSAGDKRVKFQDDEKRTMATAIRTTMNPSDILTKFSASSSPGPSSLQAAETAIADGSLRPKTWYTDEQYEKEVTIHKATSTELAVTIAKLVDHTKAIIYQHQRNTILTIFQLYRDYVEDDEFAKLVPERQRVQMLATRLGVMGLPCLAQEVRTMVPDTMESALEKYLDLNYEKECLNLCPSAKLLLTTHAGPTLSVEELSKEMFRLETINVAAQVDLRVQQTIMSKITTLQLRDKCLRAGLVGDYLKAKSVLTTQSDETTRTRVLRNESQMISIKEILSFHLDYGNMITTCKTFEKEEKTIRSLVTSMIVYSTFRPTMSEESFDGDYSYFMTTGHELQSLLRTRQLPTRREKYVPLNYVWTMHEAIRHYCYLVKAGYETMEAEEYYLVCIKLRKEKQITTLTVFNRHYTEYSSFVSGAFGDYNIDLEELSHMSIFAMKQLPVAAYENMERHYRDFTAVIGLHETTPQNRSEILRGPNSLAFLVDYLKATRDTTMFLELDQPLIMVIVDNIRKTMRSVSGDKTTKPQRIIFTRFLDFALAFTETNKRKKFEEETSSIKKTQAAMTEGTTDNAEADYSIPETQKSDDEDWTMTAQAVTTEVDTPRSQEDQTMEDKTTEPQLGFAKVTTAPMTTVAIGKATTSEEADDYREKCAQYQLAICDPLLSELNES